MTKAKKILCALLSVCVIAVPVTAGITSASAESVESLQQRLQDLDSKNKEYQKVLDSAQNDISEKEKYNEALLNKIDNLDEKISVTRESIEKLNAEISESQILGAKDFTDLIDKMSLVKNLSKYDQELIDNVNSKLDVIGKEKETLEKNKAELLQNEASLKTDLNELNTTLEANKEVLKDLYTKTDEAKDFLKNSGDEKAQIESEIAKYFAEQAAAQAKQQQQQQQQQQQAQSSSSQSSSSSSSTSDDEDDYTPTPTPTPSVTPSSSGGYVWPTPGFYYLSSEWNEDRTTYNHGAIDIAGGGIYGATVVAAASGTVAYTNTYCPHDYGKSYSCGCGGGYGKYVWIDHGNGKETIYAHLSSVAVSPGQSVSAGQVVGYVGTTGYSTGPHLHFECRYNGVKYNPMTEF